jgi:hypothetical protein
VDISGGYVNNLNDFGMLVLAGKIDAREKPVTGLPGKPVRDNSGGDRRVSASVPGTINVKTVTYEIINKGIVEHIGHASTQSWT